MLTNHFLLINIRSLIHSLNHNPQLLFCFDMFEISCICSQIRQATTGTVCRLELTMADVYAKLNVEG